MASDHILLEPVSAAPQGLSITRVIAELKGHPLAALSALFFFSAVLAAIFAPLLATQNPYDLATLNLMDSRMPPHSEGMSGEVFRLGTDDLGRDMVSAILYGLRISLMVGLVSSLVAMIIGTIVGLVSGYFGKVIDSVAMRLVDMQLSIPAILVAIILLAVLGRGVEKIIIALVTVQWVYFARTARGSTLVETKKEYVQACTVLGYSHFRIICFHILPNILPPLTVVATVEFAVAISLEATLSFLGVGLPITEPSLGLLIANGFAYLLNGEYWISIFPGIALLLLVFSLNMMSDYIRVAINPRRQA